MKADLIIKNANQLVTSKGASTRPKINEELGQIEIIEDGAVAAAADKIIAVGTTKEVLQQVDLSLGAKVIDATGKVVLPGLVDPHTHL
ncbi:MAG TPA: amidohydrolase family protein, partial [Clostridia bacterium]|nr:amidohydrolase family protein [Clostridia bacterium]